MNQIQKAYQQFFFKSEEGKYFISQVNQMIESNHDKAEKTPENARDFTQRAKGSREVLEHINSTATEIKGGKRM